VSEPCRDQASAKARAHALVPCSMPADAPSPRSESAPVGPDMVTTQRLRAVSAFLLDRPPLLLPLAGHFRDCQAVFESAIRGSSMEPAIPSLARLRVQVREQQPCRLGDIVFYLAETLPGTTYDGYIVHRAVYQRRSGSPVDYLLTRGDNNLVPDPPVRSTQVLGTVIAVQTPSGWGPPAPPVPGPFYKRAIRAITLTAMCAALWCSAATARRLAALLLTLELVSRTALRRLRRLYRHTVARYGP
jgi:hypothetical protein